MKANNHRNDPETNRAADTLRQEYQHLISEFQKLNAHNTYDALLEYLMNELAKLERKTAAHSDDKPNAQMSK